MGFKQNSAIFATYPPISVAKQVRMCEEKSEKQIFSANCSFRYYNNNYAFMIMIHYDIGTYCTLVVIK